MRLSRNAMFVLFLFVSVVGFKAQVLEASGGCDGSGPDTCTYVNACAGTLHGWCDVEATQVCEWYCSNYYVHHTSMKSIQCSCDPGSGPTECEAECECELPV